MVRGAPNSADATKSKFSYISAEEVNPGSKQGQSGAFGVYVAAHVLTGQNAAGYFQEINKLIKTLEGAKHGNYELKRSIAPSVAKINAGNSSMSNPKTDLLSAAFTAIASATRFKAAAFNYAAADNLGLIPDLSLDLKNGVLSGPLLEYISLLSNLLSSETGSNFFVGNYDAKKGKYGRPAMFKGNFAWTMPLSLQGIGDEAKKAKVDNDNKAPSYKPLPNNVKLNASAVIAALGRWINERQFLHGDRNDHVLREMANRPLLVVSYAGIHQERFASDLVKLAINGQLHKAMSDLAKIDLIGVDSGSKFNSPKWELILLHLDRFIQFFNRSTLNNFLSVRAFYPPSFYHLFKQYFMEAEKLPVAVIESAKAFGRMLNSAAYAAAKKESGETGKVSSEDIRNYKSRYLNQLESYLRSSRSKTKMMERISTVAGRMTNYDIPQEASHFISYFLSEGEETISLEQGRSLLITFMRLHQGGKKQSDAPADTNNEASEQADPYAEVG